MKQTLVDEKSGLQFEFEDEQWQLFEQYDTHPNVKKAGSAGLSCIDIIGIHQNKRVFLIECKGFKNRRPEELEKIEQRLLMDSNKIVPIAEEFLQNVKDSLLFLHFYAARLKQENWTDCKTYLLDIQKEIHLVLWLELDQSYPKIPKGRISLIKEIIRSAIVKKTKWLTTDSKVLVAGFSETPPDVEVKTI